MLERLREIQNNHTENYILPFLWMKGETHSVILEEIQKIEECGIKEICLESRPHPEFCKEGWWKDLDFILMEAKKRQMRIWVLDDKKFPTGYANGAFKDKHPELAKVYLAERHVDIMGPCRGSASLIENFLSPDGKLLGILACPKPNGETLEVSQNEILDLTNNYKDGFVFYNLPEGAYRLFVFFTTQKGGGREFYMNLLDSRSVRVLIDEVYETHYQRYHDEFGRTFAGFFSDEPEIGNVLGYPFDCLPGKRDIRLPWSEELEMCLRAKWGKNFLENLPALWYERGEKTGMLRVQFMDCVTSLVYQCFSRQIGGWCTEHGVEYIGHIIEDDNAHTRLGCSIGHYFREMKGQHMSGIDVVHHQIVPGFTEKIHQWIAGDSDGEFFHFGLAKLASSAAYLDQGKSGRALCECFGNYGWAEGVSFMKWLANHLLVRGINRFTPHAFAMSYPDQDCPPHFYARGHNLQFEEFSGLMKYMNRAAHLLSVKKPVRDAAILYHAETEWSGATYMLFQKPMRVLMENQMNADVVSDDMFEQAEVVDGKLKIGSERYPTLIIPGCKKLPVRIARFIEENKVENVFIVDMVPETDINGKALSDAFYQKVHAVSLKELGIAIKEKAQPVLESNVYFPELRSFVISMQKKLICMFFNENIHKKADLKIRFKKGAYKKITVVDLWENRSDSYQIEESSVLMLLEPGEAVFWILEEESGEEARMPIKAGEMTLKQRCQVSRKKKWENVWEPVLTILPGQEYPNMNGLDQNSRFVGTYRYEIEFVQKTDPEMKYKIKIPYAGDTAKIFLNHTDLGYMTNFPSKVDVTEVLRDGKNKLCIDVTTTLVWERRDGASTHLQIMPTGLLEEPVLEMYTHSGTT